MEAPSNKFFDRVDDRNIKIEDGIPTEIMEAAGFPSPPPYISYDKKSSRNPDNTAISSHDSYIHLYDTCYQERRSRQYRTVIIIASKSTRRTGGLNLRPA